MIAATSRRTHNAYAQYSKECYEVGSTFDPMKPECNCFGEARPRTRFGFDSLSAHPGVKQACNCAALSDTLPEIRIIAGDWVAAAVDAQLLAIVLTEVSASMPLADILASNPLAS